MYRLTARSGYVLSKGVQIEQSLVANEHIHHSDQVHDAYDNGQVMLAHKTQAYIAVWEQARRAIDLWVPIIESLTFWYHSTAPSCPITARVVSASDVEVS